MFPTLTGAHQDAKLAAGQRAAGGGDEQPPRSRNASSLRGLSLITQAAHTSEVCVLSYTHPSSGAQHHISFCSQRRHPLNLLPHRRCSSSSSGASEEDYRFAFVFRGSEQTASVSQACLALPTGRQAGASVRGRWSSEASLQFAPKLTPQTRLAVRTQQSFRTLGRRQRARSNTMLTAKVR